MPAGLHRTTLRTIALGLALGGWAVVPAEAEPARQVAAEESDALAESSATDQVMVLLVRAHVGELGARQLARRDLANLGLEGIPAFVDLLCRSVRPLDPATGRPRAIADEHREILLEVMRAWPTREVIHRVVQELGDQDGTAERVAAAGLVASIGDVRSLSSLLEILGGVSSSHLRHPGIRKRAAAVLTDYLERVPAAFESLYGEVHRMEPHLRPLVAGALGGLGQGAGVPVLRELLGFDNELDMLVLEALGRTHVWDPVARSGQCTTAVSLFLLHADPRIRRSAAIALGNLGSVEQIPDLIELLDDTDGRARSGALWALRKLTGCGHGSDSGEWQRWLTSEQEWWNERADRVVSALDSRDHGRALKALGELSEHVLYRTELTEAARTALTHENENVALAACGAILELADPQGIASLVDLLKDGRPAIQAAAERTLSVWTGHDLGPEPEAWRAFLEG